MSSYCAKQPQLSSLRLRSSSATTPWARASMQFDADSSEKTRALNSSTTGGRLLFKEWTTSVVATTGDRLPHEAPECGTRKTKPGGPCLHGIRSPGEREEYPLKEELL
mmetsp:Transcript_62109/g.111850  ORF Transcript_62109/g.111850 Transcript_62109/m.111850 type:complete len:108 (-) Transcript_62109:45-368(-)